MRAQSFDSTRGSLLDRLIWYMRTRQIRRRLPSTIETLADLGCGRTAPLLRKLLASGAVIHAIGVDLSPEMGLASDSLQLVQADLNEGLPLQSASVDVVLSLAVLEHLREPVLHLTEIHRILKPGGTLLLTTPSPLGKPVLEFMAYTLKVIDRQEIDDHKQYYEARTLVSALTQAGFAASAIHARTFQIGMNNIVVARA